MTPSLHHAGFAVEGRDIQIGVSQDTFSRRLTGPSSLEPSNILPEGSMGSRYPLVRHTPTTSKFSSENPSGIHHLMTSLTRLVSPILLHALAHQNPGFGHGSRRGSRVLRQGRDVRRRRRGRRPQQNFHHVRPAQYRLGAELPSKSTSTRWAWPSSPNRFGSVRVTLRKRSPRTFGTP